VCALTNHQGFDSRPGSAKFPLSSAGNMEGELWLSAQIVVLHCLKVLGFARVAASQLPLAPVELAPLQPRRRRLRQP